MYGAGLDPGPALSDLVKGVKSLGRGKERLGLSTVLAQASVTPSGFRADAGDGCATAEGE